MKHKTSYFLKWTYFVSQFPQCFLPNNLLSFLQIFFLFLSRGLGLPTEVLRQEPFLALAQV